IFLADQLDALAEPLTYCGHLQMVDEVAMSLPGPMIETRPRLALALAWRRTRSLTYESAEAHIAMAEQAVARLVDQDPYELRSLERAIEHRKLMLAAARDDMETVKD